MSSLVLRAWIQRRLYWALVLPALLTVLVFYIYPLSRVMWISVSEPAFGLGKVGKLASASGSLETARGRMGATQLAANP